jgi:signal transduction histidine kinase
MTENARVVLNVDDDEVGRYAKSRNLIGGGFRVVEAATGHEALRLVEELRPAVVLLDVKLPDISGIEVCRRIKQAFPGVLVLQTSATFTDAEGRTRGLDAGADAYLIQPIDSQELIASVRALMRISSAESALRAMNETLERRVEERAAELAEAYMELREEGKRLRSARAQLVQAQKMEAVGQLTGGIAHDFNNLLQVILGNLHLLSRRLGDDASDRVKHLLENSRYGAERAAILIKQLLTFSRVHSLEPEPLRINDATRAMLGMLQRTLPETIEIVTDLAAGPGWARIDPHQLDSAILNIAINARDAMPKGGKLTIQTANLVLAQPIEGWSSEFQPGEYVLLKIDDTGIGMSKEVLDKVCEPFFTTKEIGHGTGLGLSQVAGFASGSGGHLQIVSEKGQGTSVRLYFPSVPEPSLHENGNVAHGGPRGGNETILVIEDDDYVREYTTTILGELGYRVFEAGDLKAALSVLDELQDLALIFSDVGLRGELTVSQVIELARQKHPGLRVLFTSGHGRDAIAPSLAASGARELILKPFSYEDLARKVRRVLDQRL